MAVPSHLASGIWVVALLRSLQRRPGLYLGSETVAALDIYLAGYVRGRNDSGFQDDWSVLTEFRNWLVANGHLGDARVTPSMGFVECTNVLDPSDRNIYTFLRLFREFANELAVDPPM